MTYLFFSKVIFLLLVNKINQVQVLLLLCFFFKLCLCVSMCGPCLSDVTKTNQRATEQLQEGHMTTLLKRQNTLITLKQL